MAELKLKIKNPALFQPVDASIHSSDAFDIDGMDRDSTAIDQEVEAMLKSLKREQQAKTEVTQAIQQHIVALTVPDEGSKLKAPSSFNQGRSQQTSFLIPGRPSAAGELMPPEDQLKSQLSVLPPAHKVSHLSSLSQDSNSQFGSPMDKDATLSNLRPPITSHLPTDVDVDNLLDKIERQEEKKMRKSASAMQPSQFDSGYSFAQHSQMGGEDFSAINHLLNLIESRIKIFIHLGTNLMQTCTLLYRKDMIKLLFFKGVIYTLIFHSRNLVNKILQLLSQDEDGTFLFPQHWGAFLESHDHSIMTDNFMNLASGIYKALWINFKKMEPIIKTAHKNPLMVELKKMMHQPDSRLGEISDSLDTFLAAVDTSLKNTYSLKILTPGVPKEAIVHIRIQLLLARTMYHLGVFTDADAYEAYNLDQLVSRNLGKWEENRTMTDLLNDLNLVEGAYQCFTNPQDGQPSE